MAMTLNWDFTNYTFSFLITLISSILGISYPLIVESIRKIDTQYHSSLLSARFQKEKIFICFKITMLVCITISFAVPFLMLRIDNLILNVCAISIQSTAVIALVLVMLSMIKKIQTYYSPESLSDYLFGSKDPQKPVSDGELLLCAADIMRYTCYNPNRLVYGQSKEFILNAAFTEQNATNHAIYNLSDSLNDAIRLLTVYSMDEKCKPLCYDNILQQVYYNIFAKAINGDSNFKTIWLCLAKMMDSSNTEWFQQYWEGAVQYYAFIDDKRHSMNDFIEFHRVLGGMLIYHNKHEWLHFILTYDHTQPPHFYLIPGSFSSIIDFVKGIESQTHRYMLLTAKYQMKGLFHETNSDEVIVDLCYKYAALLVIRLFSYNDYNIGYCNPMDYPSINDDDTISNLTIYKKIITRIRYYIIEYWYKKNRVQEVTLPLTPELNEVIEHIDKFVSQINEKINFRLENPQLDHEKFKELKQLLVKIDNQTALIVPEPNETEKDTWSCSSIPIYIEQQLSQDICTTDGYRGWSNFPDELHNVLQYKISNYLNRLLLFTTPTKDFLISEKNVFTALNKLKIPNDYVILSMGVYLDSIDLRYNVASQLQYDQNDSKCSYHGIPVIERNSGFQAIYIIEKNGLHKMEYVQDDKEFQEKDMDELPASLNHLYSNIDKIITSGNVKPVIKLGKKIKVYQNGNTNFIRIRIKPDTDDSFEILNMLQLSEYIKE